MRSSDHDSTGVLARKRHHQASEQLPPKRLGRQMGEFVGRQRDHLLNPKGIKGNNSSSSSSSASSNSDEKAYLPVCLSAGGRTGRRERCHTEHNPCLEIVGNNSLTMSKRILIRYRLLLLGTATLSSRRCRPLCMRVRKIRRSESSELWCFERMFSK